MTLTLAHPTVSLNMAKPKVELLNHPEYNSKVCTLFGVVPESGVVSDMPETSTDLLSQAYFRATLRHDRGATGSYCDAPGPN